MAELSHRTAGSTLILLLEGRLDSVTVPEIERRIAELLKRQETRWVVDLAGLDHVSSAGLRVLLTLAKKLTARSGRLVLCSPSKIVWDILLISGFNRIFRIVPTLDAALRSDPPPPPAVSGNDSSAPQGPTMAEAVAELLTGSAALFPAPPEPPDIEQLAETVLSLLKTADPRV